MLSIHWNNPPSESEIWCNNYRLASFQSKIGSQSESKLTIGDMTPHHSSPFEGEIYHISVFESKSPMIDPITQKIHEVLMQTWGTERR